MLIHKRKNSYNYPTPETIEQSCGHEKASAKVLEKLDSLRNRTDILHLMRNRGKNEEGPWAPIRFYVNSTLISQDGSNSCQTYDILSLTLNCREGQKIAFGTPDNANDACTMFSQSNCWYTCKSRGNPIHSPNFTKIFLLILSRHSSMKQLFLLF